MRWTAKTVAEEAMRYNSKTEFAKNSGSAYNFARRNNILDEVCSHMNETRREWNIESIKEEALKYDSRIKFKSENPYVYRIAIESKILKSICTHMGNRKNQPYTIEELNIEAKKYNSKRDFDIKSNKHYRSAVRRGILDRICSHMETLWEEKWTLETVREEAMRYSTRSIFSHENRSAYNAAIRLGILDQVCSHMKFAGGNSAAEQNLFDLIKQKYPKVTKLRDRKAKIEGKPLIKGFDIDVYIPELRKGIEFDGAYWHSVPGLKRSRIDWPEEDLENYHQIKDQYFKSKGIELLHISEKEWLENKEKCIKKCLEFLGE